MGLLTGICLALVAASLIGTGQTVQKYGILQAHAQQLQQPTRGRASRGGALAHIHSKVWMLGLCVSYAGEALNILALAQAPASIVTPLNIVSVLVSGGLGAAVLGEPVSPRKLRGYGCIVASVAVIVLTAPRPPAQGARTPSAVLDLLSSTLFLSAFACVFILQTLLIYSALFRRTTLSLLVCICSLFGAITVVSAKAITSLIGASISSNISLSATSDAIPSLAILITMAGGSIVIQEYFKQEALARYSVTTFQPVFFAGFNTAAVLSSTLLFREFTSFSALAFFFVTFACAVSGILVGSRFVQDAPTDSAADGASGITAGGATSNVNKVRE
ncbi:hypothetical protein HDU83_006660 [Entophlyctis luteolus]|nr:hypothetical protein HDU82_002437 [Entophlyctis luteolus]KAJ3353582.1 hypothetical protein HDU83_006660 [Entophlyctis luteolus]KAJ3391698.1 hypothetical protein HDU84_005460 [Entophlyctis sp. JEL0112]